jgi:hypothetical protein
MSGLDFAQFSDQFYEKLRIARVLGGSIKDNIAVALFLRFLQGSRLNRKVAQMMDNPKGRDFPQTVEEVVTLMTGVWRTELAMETSTPSDNTSSIVAAASTKMVWPQGPYQGGMPGAAEVDC